MNDWKRFDEEQPSSKQWLKGVMQWKPDWNFPVISAVLHPGVTHWKEWGEPPEEDVFSEWWQVNYNRLEATSYTKQVGRMVWDAAVEHMKKGQT